jgi:hypothetical protein
MNQYTKIEYKTKVEESKIPALSIQEDMPPSPRTASEFD